MPATLITAIHARYARTGQVAFYSLGDTDGPSLPFLIRLGATHRIGAPDTVARKIQAASAVLGGVSRLTFQMSTAMLEPVAMRRSIELLGTDVAPRRRTS